MHYRTFRYLTRPMLFTVERERKEVGLPDRHEHPDFRKLPKQGRFVIQRAYPYHRGCGEGIPHMHCFVMHPEGGIAWYMDMTIDRYKRLPKMSTENPHAFRL